MSLSRPLVRPLTSALARGLGSAGIGGGTVVTACYYSLNGDAVALGFEQMVVSGGNGQTASYTTVAPGAKHIAAALGYGIPTFSATAGILQWGFTGITLPLVGTADANTELHIAAFNPDQPNAAEAYLMAIYDGGEMKCRMVVGDTSGNGTTFDTLTAPSAVWFVANTTTGKLSVFADYGDGPVALSLTGGNDFASGQYGFMTYVRQQSTMPAGYAGQTLAATLVTNGNDIPYLFNDALDICGNANLGWLEDNNGVLLTDDADIALVA